MIQKNENLIKENKIKKKMKTEKRSQKIKEKSKINKKVRNTQRHQIKEKKIKKIKILAGSINPIKINAIKKAFNKYFDKIQVLSFEVNSGVSNQPINQETFIGSKNRVMNLLEINNKLKLNADFLVSIEGGIINLFDIWFNFSVVCIYNVKQDKFSYSTTGLNEMPNFIVKKMLNNVELGKIMDELTKTKNSKQKTGAIGFLTNNKITRLKSYVYAVNLALIPFIKKEVFNK